MSVDHIVMYQKMTSNKRYGVQLPDWVYQEKFNLPAHPKRSELIGQYKEAKQQHDEWVEVLQSKWRDEQPQSPQSVMQCQQQIEQTRKALEQAEEALRQFNDHTPQERIRLYEVEIKGWETQLVEAQKLEQQYIKDLLDDPDAAKKRLERMVNGHCGTQVEYSSEQLEQLRLLKNDVELIELKILNSQRDIQRIHELVAQQEHKAQIQAIMDAAVPKFNEACAALAVALAELQSVAVEHDVRVISRYNLQLPTGAKFKQSNSPIEGDSTINIIFSK